VARQRLVFLLRRLPHLTREQFQDYWWNQHGPLVRDRAEVLGISKYQQVHTVEHLAPEGADEFDGIAELWFDGPAPTGTPEQIARAGKELLDDERTFIDLARSPIWIGEEHVMLEGPQEGLRVTMAMGAFPGVGREAYQRYWLEGHGPAVLAHNDVWGLRHYVQVHTPSNAESHPLAVNRGAPPAPHGIAEAWYGTEASTADPAHAEAVRAELFAADAPFIDYGTGIAFQSRVRVVVDRR
jgi:hypothetical protein